MPPVGQAVAWTKTPTPLPQGVQQEGVPPLVIGLDSQEPPKDQTKAGIKDKERIDWFLEEAIIHEDGALCAFHYLFDCYRKWRASYGLLATQLDQAQFAAEMQSHGVATNFERKLFLGIYALFETKD
jgi:hypothetical protein